MLSNFHFSKEGEKGRLGEGKITEEGRRSDWCLHYEWKVCEGEYILNQELGLLGSPPCFAPTSTVGVGKSFHFSEL